MASDKTGFSNEIGRWKNAPASASFYLTTSEDILGRQLVVVAAVILYRHAAHCVVLPTIQSHPWINDGDGLPIESYIRRPASWMALYLLSDRLAPPAAVRCSCLLFGPACNLGSLPASCKGAFWLCLWLTTSMMAFGFG
jgi:hypothetical protein